MASATNFATVRFVSATVKTVSVMKISCLLFVLLSSVLVAQPAPAPLPDAATLLKKLQDNQRKLDQIRKNYVCTDDEQEYDLDKQGAVKKVERRQFETYYVEGFPIRRLLSKEGVPLSEHDQKKEDERVAKDEKHARERQAKIDRGENKEKITVAEFLQTSIFKNIRREQYQGHEVIAMDFEPNPNYHPNNTEESLVNRLAGTIWIDEEASQVVRLQAKLVQGKVLGFGMASIREGSGVVMEQKRVNDELWMPSSYDADIGARVVFMGIRKRIVEQFSNYKRFKSDTRILGMEEIKK